MFDEHEGYRDILFTNDFHIEWTSISWKKGGCVWMDIGRNSLEKNNYLLVISVLSLSKSVSIKVYFAIAEVLIFTNWSDSLW